MIRGFEDIEFRPYWWMPRTPEGLEYQECVAPDENGDFVVWARVVMGDVVIVEPNRDFDVVHRMYERCQVLLKRALGN